MSTPPKGPRVRCLRASCGSHRNLQLAVCCHCGSPAFEYVRPTPGDLAYLEAAVARAGIAVDVVIQDAGSPGIDAQHPAAVALRQACRAFALAQGGVLTI